MQPVSCHHARDAFAQGLGPYMEIPVKSGSHRRLALWSIFLTVLLGAAPPAHAHPKRGSAKWSVILCTFSDSPAPPHDPAYYRNMFFNPDTGVMPDYWTAVSSGGINFRGSVVVGWYQEPFTIAQAQAQDRWTRFQSCVSAAQNST